MRNLPIIIVIFSGFILSTVSAFAESPNQERHNLEQVLAGTQFWSVLQNKAWTAHETALISEMTLSGHDPAVSLRATKILIDLAGNGRFTKAESPIVSAGFRYLEEHSGHAIIRRLLAGSRLTHYTVSTKSDGSVWLLVESIATGLNRGGINIQWDAAKAEVVAMEAWGGLAEN